MRARLRPHLTYANVVSSLCLFVLLGGTSYAAVVITGRNVMDSSLTGKDVRNNSLNGKDVTNLGTADVKDASLLAKDFKTGELPAGPTGPQGPKGDTGTVDTSGFYSKAESDGRFLAANGKAVDADELDGLDSAEVGLGFFTGRLNNLPTGDFALANGAPSGVTATPDTVNFTTSPYTTLSPNRPIVLRDLAVTLTNPVVGTFLEQRSISIAAVEPGNTLVSFGCQIGVGESSCVAAGPSPVVPARTRLVFLVANLLGPGGQAQTAGTGALFSWRASAP